MHTNHILSFSKNTSNGTNIYLISVDHEKIKSNLKGLLDSIHKFSVTVTAILPFSARSIFFNLLISPILIPIRLVQSMGPDFSQKMKAYMKHDWNRGIQDDDYTDLEGSDPKTATLRKKIVAENLCYAGYMYGSKMGNHARKIEPDFPKMPKLDLKGLNLNPELMQKLEERNRQIAEAEKAIKADPSYNVIKNITDKLVNEMGFKCDNGNFYHTGTGTIFNLVYDSNKKEIIACFMGLGNQAWAVKDINDQEKINFECVFAAAADWIGGIPKASVQAIEIGKLLKEATQGTPFKPVMIGHSHGGGLAQTGAVANGIKGVVFNSRPMGASTRRYIGQNIIAANAHMITAFSGREDWLSGNKALNYLAIAFERVTGIPVPRTVGTGYYLPELKGEDKLHNHVCILEEFQQLANMDSKVN